MGYESIIGTIILIITGLFTYSGLRNPEYQERYKFNTDSILIDREFFRLISSGFLHVNWIHFGFNMLALLSFASSLETILGIRSFLVIYFLSMVGGSLLALYIHRNHGDYSAVGASGAVSGVIAAFIILFPQSEIGLILIPIEMTSWVFGLIIILVSIIGIKSQNDMIGHEAHLGGIIVGIISTLFINPQQFIENWWVVLVLLLPIVLFCILILQRPDILITNKWNLPKPNLNRKSKSPMSMDELLDKINSKGIESLSVKEKKLLEKYSGGK